MRNWLAVVVLAGALVGILKYQDARFHLREAVSERVDSAPPPQLYTQGKPAVLFIGNSFTSVNDLPRTFARLARSLGGQPGVEGYAPGGQTFDGHSKDPQVLKLIQRRDWDFVILQEQSQRPAFGTEQVEHDTIAPALALVDMVRAAHPASRVVFYETWGRKGGDQQNCKDLPDICTYEGQQKRLDESYALMAQRAQALLAPVGEAWQKVLAEHPQIELYGGDGVHSSPQGTYLAACVFYAALTRKSPLGADKLDLDGKQALVLQQAAQRAVLGTN